LSDDPDEVLALQGVSWLKRKAIQYATVYLDCKQYTSEDGKTHIDIDQTATGGIKGSTELRTLDWNERSHSDNTFGDVVGKSRWVAQGSPEWAELDEYHKEGWLDEKVGPEGQEYVQSFTVNEERGWTANMIWGMAEVDGKRYYVRRIVVSRGDKTLRIRLVYDYQGKQ
jgi:hypothetical protein